MTLFKILVIIASCMKFDCVLCVKYTNWENLIKSSVFLSKDVNEVYVKAIVDSSNISKECKNSILDTLKALKTSEYWAFQMYDSWGKFPPNGILEGTVTDFGDYDQCLAIEPNEVIGKSQYCLIDISLPLPKPMPIHHNIFHKMNVLPEFVNKSGNNVYSKLSENASFFYSFFLRLGICSSNKCTERDIKDLAHKSKK